MKNINIIIARVLECHRLSVGHRGGQMGYFVAFTWFYIHTNIINYAKSKACASHWCLPVAQAPKTDKWYRARSMGLGSDESWFQTLIGHTIADGWASCGNQ